MKKIIYSLMAILAIAISSCTNDEIEIQFGDKAQTEVTFSITTRSMYDSFGISDNVTETYLRDKTLGVCVKTYIYDSEGNLVDSLVSGAYTYELQKQTIKLNNGTYTAVFVEGLMDQNDNYKVSNWNIQNVKKQKDAKVNFTAYRMARKDVVGISSEKFTVNDKSINVATTPEGVGVLLYVYYNGYIDTPYDKVGIFSKEMTKGIALDPSIQEQDRYITINSSSKEMFVLRDMDVEDTFTKCSIVYLPSNNAKIGMCVHDAEKASGTWSVFTKPEINRVLAKGNEYHLGFWYEKTLEPSYILTDNITTYNDWKETMGKQHAKKLVEPYTKWFSSLADVQTAMSDYQILTGGEGRTEMAPSGIYFIDYYGKNLENKIEFSFLTPTDGLIESDLFISQNATTEEDLNRMLQNQYTYITSQNGVSMYMTEDGETSIVLFRLLNDFVVGYVSQRFLNGETKARGLALDKCRQAKARMSE